jgi:hypothetical protein
MIYVALGELVVIAGLVLLNQRAQSRHDVHVLGLIAQQENERAELLTRIQRPDLVTQRVKAPPPRERTAQERAADKALGQIGTVAAPVSTDAWTNWSRPRAPSSAATKATPT